MDEDTPFSRACFVEDPDTGEVLTVEKDEDFRRLQHAFYQDECKHPNTAKFRVKIRGGQVQVRLCCTNCGDRLGTALPQKDRDLATLTWQPEQHAETYKSRRHDEWQATLLDLARRQYAQRGWFTKSYNAYMASDAWRAKRALVLKRCGEVCEGCGIAKATEVHHVHYAHLFNELLFELLGLCHSCHERLTAERREELGPLEGVQVEEDPENLPY
jgi:hypothetical protein